jgi:hypothetical protein
MATRVGELESSTIEGAAADCAGRADTHKTAMSAIVAIQATLSRL